MLLRTRFSRCRVATPRKRPLTIHTNYVMKPPSRSYSLSQHIKPPKLQDFVKDLGSQTTESQQKFFYQIMQEAASSKRDRGDFVPTTVTATLESVFRSLDEEKKLNFFTVMANQMGTNKSDIINAATMLLSTKDRDDASFYYAEQALRHTLQAPHEKLFTQIIAQKNGMKLLIDMRADLLKIIREKKSDVKLKCLEENLRNQLQHWFSIGFLNLIRITFDSPASLLEKIKHYSDSVHPVPSWEALKLRVGYGHRCYGFLHPSMPFEPLIFIEVALMKEIAGKIEPIFQQPIVQEEEATCAIFYAITSTQEGLTGVDLGNLLIKRVVEELRYELPNLTTFCTLSPIPTFRRWLTTRIAFALNPPHGFEETSAKLLTPEEEQSLLQLNEVQGNTAIEIFQNALNLPKWFENERIANTLRGPLLRLCAKYLVEEKKRKLAIDPVCNFHVRNGASVYRINWLGDLSEKRMNQSYGLMVNYLYNLNDIERNNEQYLLNGQVPASPYVMELLETS